MARPLVSISRFVVASRSEPINGAIFSSFLASSPFASSASSYCFCTFLWRSGAQRLCAVNSSPWRVS